jgi:integration host factor subunit beta
MLKSELVRRIRDQNLRLYERDVEKIVNAILGEIIAALARGDRVEIRGFGTFSVRSRPARTARNPQNGRAVPVEKKVFPYFRCGRGMHTRLNPR